MREGEWRGGNVHFRVCRSLCLSAAKWEVEIERWGEIDGSCAGVPGWCGTPKVKVLAGQMRGIALSAIFTDVSGAIWYLICARCIGTTQFPLGTASVVHYLDWSGEREHGGLGWGQDTSAFMLCNRSCRDVINGWAREGRDGMHCQRVIWKGDSDWVL